MSRINFYDDLRQEIKQTAADNPYYKNICAEANYDFDTQLDETNLEEVPYVNWAAFKESNQLFDKLLRIPFEELSHWTISSSTSGDPSIVGRAPEDVKVFQENYKRLFEQFSYMSTIQKLVLFSPSVGFMNRMPGTWMGKRGFLFYRDITDIWNLDTTFLLFLNVRKLVFHLLTHFKFKTFIEVNGKALLKALKDIEKRQIPALVGNSAPLMFKTFNDCKQAGQTYSMPETFRVQTGGGGWSGVKGRVKTDPIDKAVFIESLSELFNINSSNFADCFGATESPTAFGGHWSKTYGDFLLHVEKEHAQIILRSIDTFERIRDVKEPGVLEIITPYGVKSYTGLAVLLDDIVEVVDFNRCPDCGRENVIIFRHLDKLTPQSGKGCSSYTRLFPFAEKKKE
jgi:hypothetical protein